MGAFVSGSDVSGSGSDSGCGCRPWGCDRVSHSRDSSGRAAERRTVGNLQRHRELARRVVDLVLQDAHRIVMNGLNLHAVVGRRIFETWHMTRALLETADNGIQDAVWKVILNEGQGTLVDIHDWDRARFEQVIQTHPKALIRFS